MEYGSHYSSFWNWINVYRNKWAQKGGDAIKIELPIPMSTISSVDTMGGYEGSSEPNST